MTSRACYLIYRHIISTISEEEREELNVLLADDPVSRKFMEQLADTGDLLKDLEMRSVIDSSRPYREMQMQINLLRRRKAIRTFAKVAAVLIIIAVPALWVFIPENIPQSAVTEKKIAVITADDFKPGQPSATISVPGGVSHALCAEDLGVAATSLTAEIIKENPGASSAICLDVPRGGEFKIVLEDSTVVWLNSESQLRYPTTFADNERRVSVCGEVYFSVKKDESRPFYVESPGQEVRVYGTTFNIKAYPEEKFTYTTLESGSISLRQLSGEGGELVLSPGHQAVYDPTEGKVNMKVVNTGVITGWHHGRFVFEEQPLANIMRDLSRWYDFQYSFADPQLENIVFMGSIPRYGDFKTALMTLEKSGGIEFEITEEKIIIHKKR